VDAIVGSASGLPDACDRAPCPERRVRRSAVVISQEGRDLTSMMSNVFTPKGFLTYGGAILLLLGIVGFLGVFSQSAFPSFWLDNGENVAHTGLGIIALAIVFVPGLNSMFEPYYRWIVILLGIVALFFAVYGFVVAGDSSGANTFGLANLESPADDILHLVVGAWALYAAWRPAPMMAR
jgi:hypothetical protein